MKNLTFIFIGVLCGLLFVSNANANEDKPSEHHSTASTVSDPDIPLDELELLLKPMTSEELLVEADAWFKLLRETALALNLTKLEVKRDNVLIENSGGDGGPEDNPADQGTVDKVLADKDKALEHIATLREKRTALIDRLSLILDAITKKTGLTTDQTEQPEVLVYRNYISVNHGITVDVSDTKSTWSTLVKWLESKEGGRRWGRHIGVFLSAVLGFWLLGILLSKLVGKALGFSSNISLMMKQFIVKSVRTVLIFIGILIGLSALEINVTPVLAVIGATGFIVAFALQDTLSNFASGLMILLYRPFDVDDWVDVSGASGKVKSMTLVTTTIMTSDNKLMIVPNNSIWGNIITNVTGSNVRRVDLKFGISYDADLDQAQHVLEDIMARHEQILEKPAPVVHVHELADSSVILICRPWVKTDDYWTVYWDMTREVKLRFDAEGISIPFPQREMHIYDHSAKIHDPKTVDEQSDGETA